MHVHVYTTTCTYHVHTMYIHVCTFTEMYIHVCTCLCFSIIVYAMSVSRCTLALYIHCTYMVQTCLYTFYARWSGFQMLGSGANFIGSASHCGACNGLPQIVIVTTSLPRDRDSFGDTSTGGLDDPQ
jgi:hypothetical protein